MKTQLSSFIILVFFTTFLCAQQTSGWLRGRVIDAETSQVLSQVNITIDGTSYGDASDLNGDYEIGPIPAKSYLVTFSMIGYESASMSVVILPNDTSRINISLISKVLEGEEILIQEERHKDEPWRKITPSTFEFRGADIIEIPGAFEDVMQSLQTFPGIMTLSDFSNQLIVRGGSPDQNLILLDGIELYSPYKLNGMASLLNPDMLADVTIFTGGYPAIYGDRLSSVISGRVKDGGLLGTVSGKASVNFNTANLTFETPLPFNGGWIQGIRHAYYQYFGEAFTNMLGIGNEIAFPAFSDIQTKMFIRPLPYLRLEIFALINEDILDLLPFDTIGEQDTTVVPPVGGDSIYNSALSFTMIYTPTPYIIGKVYGRFFRNHGSNTFKGSLVPRDNSEGGIFSPPPIFGAGDVMYFEYDKSFDFLRYSGGTQWLFQTPRHDIDFGIGYQQLQNSLDLSMKTNELGNTLLGAFEGLPNWLGAMSDTLASEDIYGRWHIYLQDRWALIPNRLYVQPSVRYDHYDISNAGYLSPRINLSFELDQGSIIKASWGQYYQSPGFEKVISPGRGVRLAPYNTMNNLEAESATHIVVGYEQSFKVDWDITIEAYRKNYSQLITQQQSLETVLRAKYVGGESMLHFNAYRIVEREELRLLPIGINDGVGDAIGLEMLLRRSPSDTSPFSGWLSYAYSRASRNRASTDTSRVILFDYDRPHALDFVLNYRPGKSGRLRIGMVMRYGTGFPSTNALRIEPLVAVVDGVPVILTDPETLSVRLAPDFGGEENRNAARLPDYHRLDLRISYTLPVRNASLRLYLDIINLYNQKNVLYYDYLIKVNPLLDDVPVWAQPSQIPELHRRPIYMLPFLPTFGMSINF